MKENGQESLFPEIEGATYSPPSILKLMTKATRFLMENRPDVQGKERALASEAKAKAAKRYAENLIANGVPAEQAWNRAIRLEILESETD